MTQRELKAVAAYLWSPVMDEGGGLYLEMFTAIDAAAEEEGMMGQGYGMMFGGIFMWLFWLLLIGGVVWLISMLFRSNRPTSPGETALDRLKMRYAKGEIDRIEFEQKKKGLE